MKDYVAIMSKEDIEKAEYIISIMKVDPKPSINEFLNRMESLIRRGLITRPQTESAASELEARGA